MKLTFRWAAPALAALLFAVSSTTAVAAEDVPPALVGAGFWHAVFASLVFGLVGIVLAIIGFKLFDLVTPFDLEKEMCENKNIAVGILCGAIVLGVCHIIAASIS